MRHLSDGALRRMVDEPLAVTTSQRDHYNTCSRCQSLYKEMTLDAQQATDLLAMPELRLDPARALAQTRPRLTADRPARGRLWNALADRLSGRRLTAPLSAAAVAVLLIGGAALTPAGSWAQSFITIFQPQQIAAVQVTSADLQNLPKLRQYGTVRAPTRVQPIHAASAHAAAGVAKMQVLVPGTLPSGVTAQPTFNVLPSKTGIFTFSAQKARQTAARKGETLPAMPAQIDGSSLQITTGTAVVATYKGQGGIPSLIVGQMQAPHVSSTGVSVKQLEDYVLGLPGVSPHLAQTIRAIGNPSSTLPIPIPVDMAHADSVTVEGVHGLAIGDNTGIGTVVVWQKGNMIYGVGGPMSENQALAVANSLH